jgi:N-acetylglucosamine kinase-like BadF-type ATPase
VDAPLVVGIDAGATTTRCLVVSSAGDVVGRAEAAGANIRSSDGRPEDTFRAALTGALGAMERTRVQAGVFGVAGGGSAGRATVRTAADRAWQDAGLPGRPEVVTDLEVAFAAGTARPDGLLLLAGTGAAAASFAGRRIVRRCDGYGWLLGDQGSAVWFGLRGVRAALDAHDGRGPDTRLRADLAAHIGTRAMDDLPQLLIARLHADAPAQLGALGRLVTAAAVDGDAVALGLVADGADRLVAGLRAASAGALSGEVVLAGALLATGPVRDAVIARLSGEDALRLRTPGPGAAGAAALALAVLSGGQLADAQHAQLLHAAARSS